MKNAFFPLLVLSGLGAWYFLRGKKQAGENLQYDPIEVQIDMERTKESLFLKIFYKVKIRLTNTEQASVNVRRVNLEAFVNDKRLSVITNNFAFAVPGRSSQIVQLSAFVSTLGAGAFILDMIKNGQQIKINIMGQVTTDLGTIDVNFEKILLSNG